MLPDPAQLNHVRRSFAEAARRPDFGLRFYAHLFRRDPSLRHLFPAQLDAQAERLMAMIALAVNKLGDLPNLVPVLQQLGRRHVAYGVTEAQYAVVGAAFLDTLAEVLGADFTDARREAWTAVYGLMARTMIDAAHVAEAA